MAIMREINASDTYITYLSTVALFCAISCTIVMIRFRGFKATLNLSSGKASGTGRHYEVTPQVSLVGAYRTSKDEYFSNINYSDARKVITPSMVKLPPGNIKPSKSTGDLVQVQHAPEEVRKSTPNINIPNTAQETKEGKNQLKAQKKLEKERLIEQKKREKLAAQERKKQEQIQRDREKQAAQQQAKEAKEREKQRKRKGVAPQPTQRPQQQPQEQPQQKPRPEPQQQAVQQTGTPQQKLNNDHEREHRTQQKREAPPPPHFKKVAQRALPNTNTPSHKSVQNPRNSLESSISRSSGPPPYSDTSDNVLNKNDYMENITFEKPAEVSSGWDMISQHRQQMSRTAAVTVHNSKQKNIDLQYNVGNITNNDRDNSEA